MKTIQARKAEIEKTNPNLRLVSDGKGAQEIAPEVLLAAHDYLTATGLSVVYFFGSDYSTFGGVPRSAPFVALSQEEINTSLL